MGCGRCRNKQKNPEKHSYKYLMTLKIVAVMVRFNPLTADLITQVLLQNTPWKSVTDKNVGL